MIIQSADGQGGTAVRNMDPTNDSNFLTIRLRKPEINVGRNESYWKIQKNQKFIIGIPHKGVSWWVG
jgi:hypothetical protein